MTAPTSPSPDSLAAVVAAVQSTADPIEQMLKVCSVSREHDLLISRTWVLAWAELWQAERAGRERLDAEMRKDIAHKDALIDQAEKECAELGAKLAACERQHKQLAHCAATLGQISLTKSHKEAKQFAQECLDYCAAIASRAAPNDISTPRPTDCAEIREGRVTVLARDQKGEACMTMVPIHPWQGVGAVNQEEPPRS